MGVDLDDDIGRVGWNRFRLLRLFDPGIAQNLLERPLSF
jgi:hypothetical protein